MKEYQEIRDTSPLGLKMLNDQLRLLWFKTKNTSTKDVRDGAITGEKIQIESIDGEHIKPKSITTEHIEADFAMFADLQATNAYIQQLDADKANINDLTALNATIENLKVSKADIVDLTAETARINTLYSNYAEIDTILSQSIFAELAEFGEIRAGSAIIADEAIGNSQISSLSVDKLEAGTISTAKFTVIGSDGRLKIQDNLLQVFDGAITPFERIALGDVNSDGSAYGLRIRGADGETVLFDENGQTSEGFTDGYNKLETNSLEPDKINIERVVSRINDSTETFKSSKVLIDNETLDVKFSTVVLDLANQGQEISNHSTQIIALDGEIALKLDSQDFTTYTDTIDGDLQTITTNLSKSTTDITALQGQIVLKVEQTDIETAKTELQGEVDTVSTKIDTKVGEIYTSIDGVTTRVSATETNIGSLGTRVNTAESSIQAIAGSIALKADSLTVEGLVTRISYAELNIDGFEGKIEAKVSKNGIIAAITATPETIKIQASKIKLEGLVTANKYFKVLTDGSIEAKSGKIGGWNLSDEYLQNISGSVGIGVGNLAPGSAAFWSGYNSSTGSYKFRVTNAGQLFATEADISGKITATSGNIGGWNITPSSLQSADGSVGMGGVYDAFWAGWSSNNGYGIGIHNNGVLRADYLGIKRLEIIYDRLNFYTPDGRLGGNIIGAVTPDNTPSLRVESGWAEMQSISASKSLGSSSFHTYKGTSTIPHSAGIRVQDDFSKYSDIFIQTNKLSSFSGNLSSQFSTMELENTGIASLYGTNYIALKATTYAMGMLAPWEADAYSLGNATYRWRYVYLNNNPNVSSDTRIKDNIQEIPQGLIDELKHIQPKMYQQNNKWHFGYIAQDVERTLYKYALKKVGWDSAKDYASQFEVLYKDESYLSLIYAEIAVLKEAEMQKRIDELESKVNTLIGGKTNENYKTI